LHENVLDKVRAHYEDLKSGQRIDAEVKVLFLGNGGVGKTQLRRRLRDLKFDPSVPTTHGIQLCDMTLPLEGLPATVRLNLWDFGGQADPIAPNLVKKLLAAAGRIGPHPVHFFQVAPGNRLLRILKCHWISLREFLLFSYV
jgi:hypothetical protein